jgi:hypothetical protein
MVNGREAVVEKFTLQHVAADPTDNILAEEVEQWEGEDEQEYLRKLFLRAFATTVQTSMFTHPVDMEYNVLRGLCERIAAKDDFVECSVAIARHLISVSGHHNIKSGDLFVVKFREVEFQARAFEAVGIFKFDEKESFLESRRSGGRLEMDLRRGLGSGKPNKGCLVIFTDEEPTLFILDDNPNTEYWQKDFIGHKPKNDHVNSTSHILELTKDFITKQLPQNYEIPKADQIDLLNRSVQYFKSNTDFDRDAFEQEVFQEEGVIRSFQQFGERFKESRELDILDNFEISAQAVKKQARIFKSVIKLDKNFHIYIHGDRNKIEQGVDETGRKFYKIYYEEEK